MWPRNYIAGGFPVGMRIGNAKAIDLFANKDERTISIQVKAIRNKRQIRGEEQSIQH